MFLTRLIASLLAVLPSPAAAAATVSQGGGGTGPTPRIELLGVESWADLLARDARCGFGLRTASSAVAVLEDRAASEVLRSAAVLALGAGRCGSERSRVLALAGERNSGVRQAAIWALGCYGLADDVGTLIDLTGRKSEELAEAAIFALALHGSRDALAALSAIEADPASPHRETARAAQGFRSSPPVQSELARAFLALRFDAARRHGLVDGQAWESLLLEDLAHNQKFLNRVVYRCASDLRRPGVKDHFLEIALAGSPPERLRGVVAAIPEELCALIDSGLFTPADDGEWGILLDEIDERHLERRTDSLLRRAWAVPALRAPAAALLARTGAPQTMPLLEVHLRSNDPRERAIAAAALGAARDPSYIPDLSALEADGDASVRSAALVARVRLGDLSALALARERFGVGEQKLVELHPDAPALYEAFVAVASDPTLRGLGEAALERLPTGLKGRLAAELLLGGHEPSREIVRQTLASSRPTGAAGARAVRALATRPTSADIAVIRGLFPLGDELEVDVELGRALLALRDAEVVPLLRSALWSEPWNRSVLAGALWIEVEGIEALRIELQRPPAGAGPRDMRRVGFALGEWGGVAEVELLASRISPAEPALQGAVLGALGGRTH